MVLENNRESLLKLILRTRTKNTLSSLEKYIVSNPDVPPYCEPIMVKKLQNIITEVISRTGDCDYRGVKIVLQVIQHVASFPDDEGIRVLLDNNLLLLISELLSFILGILHSNKDSGQQLFEEILETIEMIADSGSKAKDLVIECFCDRLIQIIISKKFNFHVRNETCKTLNGIMEQCTLPVKEKLKSSQNHRMLMYDLANVIPTVGDYELQVGIVECLFRLTHKSDRSESAKTWYQSADLVEGFLGIKERDFETDSRKYLLMINKNTNSRVNTIPAEKVLIGNLELKRPKDKNYDAFWIDFNYISQRISWFCEPVQRINQDNCDVWETVSVWSENVRDYVVKEMEERKKVVIELKSPIKDLINIGQDVNNGTVTMYFDKEYDIDLALVKTFGTYNTAINDKASVKCSIVVAPVHSEQDRNCDISKPFSGSMSKMEKRPTSSTKSRKCKVSESIHLPQSARKRKTKQAFLKIDGTEPLTLNGRNKERKVKVPLQFIADDTSEGSSVLNNKLSEVPGVLNKKIVSCVPSSCPSEDISNKQEPVISSQVDMLRAKQKPVENEQKQSDKSDTGLNPVSNGSSSKDVWNKVKLGGHILAKNSLYIKSNEDKDVNITSNPKISASIDTLHNVNQVTPQTRPKQNAERPENTNLRQLKKGCISPDSTSQLPELEKDFKERKPEYPKSWKAAEIVMEDKATSPSVENEANLEKSRIGLRNKSMDLMVVSSQNITEHSHAHITPRKSMDLNKVKLKQAYSKDKPNFGQQATIRCDSMKQTACTASANLYKSTTVYKKTQRQQPEQQNVEKQKKKIFSIMTPKFGVVKGVKQYLQRTMKHKKCPKGKKTFQLNTNKQRKFNNTASPKFFKTKLAQASSSDITFPKNSIYDFEPVTPKEQLTKRKQPRIKKKIPKPGSAIRHKQELLATRTLTQSKRKNSDMFEDSDSEKVSIYPSPHTTVRESNAFDSVVKEFISKSNEKSEVLVKKKAKCMQKEESDKEVSVAQSESRTSTVGYNIDVMCSNKTGEEESNQDVFTAPNNCAIESDAEIDFDMKQKICHVNKHLRKKKKKITNSSNKWEVGDDTERFYYKCGSYTPTSTSKESLSSLDRSQESELSFGANNLPKTAKLYFQTSPSETGITPLRDLSSKESASVESSCIEEPNPSQLEAYFKLNRLCMKLDEIESEGDRKGHKGLLESDCYLKKIGEDEVTDSSDESSDNGCVEKNDEICIETKLQSGVSSLLHSFGSEIQMHMLARKDHLEHTTGEVVKHFQKQISGTWMTEQNNRKALLKRFKDTVQQEIENMEMDIRTIQKAEDTCVAFFNRQQKIMTKARVTQYQRLKKLEQIEEEFRNDITSNSNIIRPKKLFMETLQKEMRILKNKIMQQMQESELRNVKRSLEMMIM